MNTLQYQAKRAILDRLEELARTGPLSTMGTGDSKLQIKRDARVSDMEDRCMYAGGTRMERPSDQIMQDAESVCAAEAAYTSWFIRINGPSDVEVEDLERIAEDIGEVFDTLIAENPGIAGERTQSFVSSSQGDHSIEDITNVAVLMYEVRTEGFVG